MSDRRAKYLIALFLGLAVGPLLILLLAIHVDRGGAFRVLKWLLAFVVIAGTPVALAAAAIQRRYGALAAMLSIGVVAATLVAMARFQFPDLQASIKEDAWLPWTSFYALSGLSAFFALGVVTIRREYLLVTTIVILGLIGTALVFLAEDRLPGFISSMQEDAWAEWATFYAFLGAGLLSAVVALRSGRQSDPRQGGRWLPRAILFGIALFSIVVAGEEISWGQRLFSFEPPEIFEELNYQQELNVHNIFRGKALWNIPLDTRYLVIYASVFLGMILPAAAWLVGKKSKTSVALAELLGPTLYLSPGFAAVALSEITYPGKLTGEASELTMGVILLADGLLRVGAIRPRSGATRRVFHTLPMALALPFALGVITPRAVEGLSTGDSSEAVAKTRAELELLREDVRDARAQGALLKKTSVHRRLFTAVRAGTLKLGKDSRFLEARASPAVSDAVDPRRDRRGYFLDPWNNSYWIRYVRARSAAIFYSFGPNRRRDTDFDGLSDEAWRTGTLEGDDIGVSLAFSETP